MAMNIRATFDPGKTLVFKIEQLSTGFKYDFSTGTFVSNPVTPTSSLPESSDPGGYDLTVHPTPADVFTDGHYTLRVLDGKTSIANLASRMTNGDDAPPTVILSTQLNVIADPSFEAAQISNYVYTPTGSPWLFSSQSGLTQGETAWGAAIPDGKQVAFLQGAGTIMQSVTLPNDGLYQIQLFACQRAQNQQQIQISLDLMPVLTFTPDNIFTVVKTPVFVLPKGTYNLRLSGLVTSGDNSAFVDMIQLYSIDARIPIFFPKSSS